MMKIEGIETFVTAAEQSSLTEAARTPGSPRSVVSGKVAEPAHAGGLAGLSRSERNAKHDCRARAAPGDSLHQPQHRLAIHQTRRRSHRASAASLTREQRAHHARCGARRDGIGRVAKLYGA